MISCGASRAQGSQLERKRTRFSMGGSVQVTDTLDKQTASAARGSLAFGG
jgi:hypothetical protein